MRSKPPRERRPASVEIIRDVVANYTSATKELSNTWSTLSFTAFALYSRHNQCANVVTAHGSHLALTKGRLTQLRSGFEISGSLGSVSPRNLRFSEMASKTKLFSGKFWATFIPRVTLTEQAVKSYRFLKWKKFKKAKKINKLPKSIENVKINDKYKFGLKILTCGVQTNCL